MAGAQGMGSPSQVKPEVQPVPQPVELPAVQAASNPLDEIYSSAPSAQTASGNPLDEIYGQSSETQAAEQSTFSKFLDEGKKAINADPLASSAIELGKGALWVANKVTGAVAGAAQGIADVNEGKAKTADSSLWQGIKDPDKVAPLSESIERIVPITKTKIPLPVTDQYSYAEDRAGNPSYETSTNFTNKSIDTIPASKAIAFAIDAEAGNLALKGITKAFAVSKLIGKAVKPAEKAIMAAKVSSVESVLDPVAAAQKQAEGIKQAAQKLEELTGVNVPLTPAMKNPASGEIQSLTEKIADHSLYQQTQEAIGNGINNLATKIIPDLFSSATGSANPNSLLSLVKGVKGKSGGKIGSFIEEAESALQGTVIKSPQFESNVNTLVEGLTSGDETKLIELEEGARKKELTTFLNKKIEQFYNKKDGIPFEQFQKDYKYVSDMAKIAWERDYETKYAWSNLRTGLSADQNEIVGSVLFSKNPEASEIFKGSKAAFAEYMNNSKELKSYLKPKSVTGEALMNHLTKENVGMADRVNAFTNVLGIENPEAIKDFRRVYYNHELEKFAVDPSPKNPFGYDFEKFGNRIQEMAGLKTSGENGQKVVNALDLMTGSEKASEALISFSKVAKSFSQTYVERSGTIANEHLFGRMVYYANKVRKGDANGIISPIIDSFQRDANLKKIFDQMDIEEIVKGFPINERASALEQLRKIKK